jgi:diguanylate cyclase (GGDEF)-like protein
LKQIATCISSCLHETTEIAARYGGDEFAALLPRSSPLHALERAEQIRKSVTSLSLESDATESEPTTVSIGVAIIVARPDLSPADLIAAADAALYEAKRNGRNQTQYTDAARKALSIVKHAAETSPKLVA